LISKRKMELLKANENTEKNDIQLAKNIDDDRLETAKRDDIIHIRKLIRETGREIHKMKGFVRFKQLGEKVKCGYMKPEHDIGFMVADWFAKRFPGYIIVLGNERESWVSIYTEKGISNEKGDPLETTLKELKEYFELEEEIDLTKLWETYYKSQYSENRKNKELFNKNMPKKYMKRTKTEVEKKFEMRDLNDY